MVFYSKFSLCVLSCISAFAREVPQEGPQPIRVSARHIEGGGIGYNEGYTTLEAFFSPVKPFRDAWVPFLDLRGHLFNNGRPAANAGVGFRYMSCHRIWGGNAYYDYRRTNRQHYNQVAAGFESLGRVWDFRINGYLPVGKKTSSFWGSHFDHFHKHFAFVKGKKEFALKGVNAEAAAHIQVVKNVDFTVGMGPYYLAGHGEAAWGGQARVGLDLFRYCKLEGFASYDSIFKWTGQGQLRISAPFGGKRKIQRKGCPPSTTLAMRSVQPVERFEIIPVDRKKSLTKAIDPSTGKPYFFWFVDNTSHSQGTFESPFPTLIAAQDASRSGDVIYVFPGDGTSQGLDAGIVLKNHQYLFGAGISHRLPTTTGGMLIPAQAIAWPSLTAAIGSPVVTVANNNTISGFQIAADGNGAINGSYCIGSSSAATKNLSVTSNILTANHGAAGILPNQPSGKVTISNNTIQSSDQQGTYGIYLAQMSGEGSYKVENNLISNFQSDVIFFPDVPSGTAIAILALNQSQVRAIVSNNQIAGCTGHGIDFHAFGTGNPHLAGIIQGNQLEGVPLQGIGTFLFSDDQARIAFQVSDNRINEFAFGIVGQAEGNSSMEGWIQGNRLSNGPLGSGIIVETNLIDQVGGATGLFHVVSNDVSRYGDAQGIAAAAYGTSSLTAFIENNNIHEIGKAGVFFQAFNFSNSKLVVTGNIIDGNNGGMEVDAFEESTADILIQGNVITNNNGAGVFANPKGNSHPKYAILDNLFSGNNQMSLNTGSAVTIVAEDATSVCLRMNNNQSSMEATEPDYDLQNTGSGQFSVEPLVGNTGTINQSGTTPVPPGFCAP